MAPNHVALSSWHAVRTTATILKIQSLAKVVIVYRSFRHNRTLFIKIGAPSGYKFRRLCESVGIDSIETTSVTSQTFIIVQSDITHSIIEEIVFEHVSLTTLALPLHWQASSRWHTNRKCCSLMHVSSRVRCCCMVLELVNLSWEHAAFRFTQHLIWLDIDVIDLLQRGFASW